MQAAQISSSVREETTPKNKNTAHFGTHQYTGEILNRFYPPNVVNNQDNVQVTNVLPFPHMNYSKVPLYSENRVDYQGKENCTVNKLNNSNNESNGSLDLCQVTQVANTANTTNSINTNSLVPPTPRTNTQNSASKVKENIDLEARKVFAKYWSTDGVFYYCMKINNVYVCRRSNDSYINGTKLLNAAKLTRGRRDGMLKKTIEKFIVRNGIAPLRGVWIPLSVAQNFAKSEGIEAISYPLLEDNLEVAFKNNPQFLSAMSKKMDSIRDLPASATVSKNGSSAFSSVNNSPLNLKHAKKDTSMLFPSADSVFKSERGFSDKLESLKAFRNQLQPTPKELHPKPTFSSQQLPPLDFRNAASSSTNSHNHFYSTPSIHQQPARLLEKTSHENSLLGENEKNQSKNYNLTNEQLQAAVNANAMQQNKQYEMNPQMFGMPVQYFPQVLSWPYMQNFQAQEEMSKVTFSPQGNFPLLNSPRKQQQQQQQQQHQQNYTNYAPSSLPPPLDYSLHLPFVAYQNYPYCNQQLSMHQNPK